MSAIQGHAVVDPAPLAPTKAQWEVNAEAKTSTATILGGTAVITRRDTGEFSYEFTLPLPAKGEPGEEGYTEEGAIIQRARMSTAGTLFEAQQKAETMIREGLSRSNREVFDAASAAEQAEAKANAGDDPF